jgi:hypothetical protein
MSTTISLDSRKVFSIASDMDEINQHLRVSHDMVMDQLCDFTTNDLGSTLKVLERIFFLTSQIPQKLSEAMALNDELTELVRAAKLTA